MTEAVRSLAEAATPCAYCGMPADTVDHVVPRAARGYVTFNWRNLPDTVPACRECNALAGDRVVESSVAAKRRRIHDLLRARYRHLLAMPEHSADELATLGDRLRRDVGHAIHRRDTLLQRLAWPGPSAHVPSQPVYTPPPAQSLPATPGSPTEVSGRSARLCEYCREPIPSNRRSDARFCCRAHMSATAPTTVMSIRVAYSLVEWVDEYARSHQMTRSEAIAESLRLLQERATAEETARAVPSAHG